MSDERKPTAELAKTARGLASELFKGACERSTVLAKRCLDAREEIPKGKRGRPERISFLDYDPKAMCLPCAAYWHAERTAQLLEHRLADEYASIAAKKEERTC
jgi:hypothetical protein